MAIETTIDKNLRFLVLEVIKQVERTQRVLNDPTDAGRRRVEHRDDYIDHLRSIIENKIFEFLGHHGNLDKSETDHLRSVGVVASNLERIADHCVNVVGQTLHFQDARFFRRYAYAPFFEEMVIALRNVLPAVRERDTEVALAICQSEGLLDELYRAKFERILAEMALGQEVSELVTSLFIFHYLERIGDCLKNIGEAVIFSKMGERLKFHQYQAVRDAMDTVSSNGAAAEGLDFEGIWGTRSGCRIGKIREADPVQEDGERGVIYKEGNRDKIRLEKEAIEKWETLVPGLAPKVIEYQDNERGSALLIEYLEGRTYQDLLLNGDERRLPVAQELLETTLAGIWDRTLTPEPRHPRFVGQLASRLDDVMRVHPFLRGSGRQIGVLRIPDLPRMLERNQHLDDELACPFSVFGHGDFNIDNIIFDFASGRLHFIDLHRSRPMDYVHMMSVFMVSIFRLPVFDEDIRDLMNDAVSWCYRFAGSFAAKNKDRTFQARLALGLVRNFTTSTRFESDPKFAQNLVRRASYLLEKLDAHNGLPWDAFQLPEEVLFY